MKRAKKKVLVRKWKIEMLPLATKRIWKTVSASFNKSHTL